MVKMEMVNRAHLVRGGPHVESLRIHLSLSAELSVLRTKFSTDLTATYKNDYFSLLLILHCMYTFFFLTERISLRFTLFSRWLCTATNLFLTWLFPAAFPRVDNTLSKVSISFLAFLQNTHKSDLSILGH